MASTVVAGRSLPATRKRFRGLTLTIQALKNAAAPLGGGSFYALIIPLFVGFIYPGLKGISLDAYLSTSALTGILGTSVKHVPGFVGFLGIETYSSIYGLLFGGILAYIGGAAIPATIEDGTLDLALSRPISRGRYYIEFGLAAVLGIILISLVTILGVWLSTFLVKDANVDWQWLWLTQWSQTSFMAIALGFGMLCGASLNSSKAAGWTGVGVLILAYLLNTFGGVAENLNWMRKITPFYYANGLDTLLKHDLTWWHPWMLIGLGLLFGIAGLVIFQRRDLPTT